MSAMMLEQKRAVAKAIHEGLYRNGTVVMYSGAFERIVENAIDAHLTAHAQMVEKVRDQEAEIAGYRTLIDLLRTDKRGTKLDYVASRAGTMVNIADAIGNTK